MSGYGMWTGAEKKLLLRELLKHPPQFYPDRELLEELAEATGKTPVEVDTLLEKYRNEAIDLTNDRVYRLQSSRRPRAGKKPEPPLEEWIWMLRRTNRSNRCFRDALNHISERENHPAPEDCDGVDLKALYAALAVMTTGEVPQNLNAESEVFIKATLTSLRRRVISSEKAEKLNFVGNITRLFPNLDSDDIKCGVAEPPPEIVEFFSNIKYNPLGIPLKLSENDVKLKPGIRESFEDFSTSKN